MRVNTLQGESSIYRGVVLGSPYFSRGYYIASPSIDLINSLIIFTAGAVIRNIAYVHVLSLVMSRRSQMNTFFARYFFVFVLSHSSNAIWFKKYNITVVEWFCKNIIFSTFHLIKRLPWSLKSGNSFSTQEHCNSVCNQIRGEILTMTVRFPGARYQWLGNNSLYDGLSLDVFPSDYHVPLSILMTVSRIELRGC